MDAADSNSNSTGQGSSSVAMETLETMEAQDKSYGEEIDTYYFESDHIALKGNPDYHLLLKTIAQLESQRMQAIKDLDILYEKEAEALQDPIKFVEKLQCGADLNLPKPQKIVPLPTLNWENYTSSVDFTSLGLPKHMTRLKKQLVDGTENDQKPALSTSGMIDDQSVTVVRGRVKDENKSHTFNKLWTVEEQKRLEDLLRQYPPEEVEAKRWQKIAVVNLALFFYRLKVASRVQKYFIKLAKAGLPIPGRMPNMSTYFRKAAHRHHRFHKFYQQQSTFLTSHEPPVYMSDDESRDMDGGFDPEGSLTGSLQGDSTEASDDESIPAEFRNTPEYKEIIRLKRLKEVKIRSQTEGPPQHLGFKCDKCDCEPIVGTRWHCMDCPIDESVDFCDNCTDSYYETEKHNSSHRLKAVTFPEGNDVMDTDYMTFMPGDYNYLDPNYMPAS